ncbi:MAG TPA: hypothetical protein P5205_17680 [Candidatus Paceibacterota bacterium]|nr:hypothetical protein [Verrucomicrobiota bacterium]HSA12195.1 hypothetical protein [Candidatus Paceibacterota bacterium]
MIDKNILNLADKHDQFALQLADLSNQEAGLRTDAEKRAAELAPFGGVGLLIKYAGRDDGPADEQGSVAINELRAIYAKLSALPGVRRKLNEKIQRLQSEIHHAIGDIRTRYLGLARQRLQSLATAGAVGSAETSTEVATKEQVEKAARWVRYFDCSLDVRDAGPAVREIFANVHRFESGEACP